MDSKTVEQFMAELGDFLDSANANLGRRTSKNRSAFINAVLAKVSNFISPEPVENKSKRTLPNKDVLCMKPTNKSQRLEKQKGAHVMTSSESQRADEELGRSPF